MSVYGQKSTSLRWMWATFPINAAFMVFTTLLPLYVLSIKGNVLDITSLFAVYNIVQIPSVIFWGSVIDRIHRRALFLVIAFVGCSIAFAGMFLLPNVALLFPLCGLLGIAVAACGPVWSLLVMETAEKKAWYGSFGRLFFIANLGSTLGLTVGLVWPSSISIAHVLLFCSVSSAISVLLAYLFVAEPQITPEVPSLSWNQPRLLAKFYGTVSGSVRHLAALPKSLSRDAMISTHRALRRGIAQEKSTVFFFSVFYMTGWSILNMSYVAFLSSNGISSNWIFGITFTNMAVQLTSYATVGALVARLGVPRLRLYSIILTAAPYGLIGACAFFLRGPALLFFNLALFSLAGMGYALWNSSISLALYSNLGTNSQGGVLGAFNALIELGIVIGSLTSGIISFYIGYSTTFVLSCAIILTSSMVLRHWFKIVTP